MRFGTFAAILAAGLYLAAGCATKQFTFDSRAAAAYVAAHSERPPLIKESLARGALAVGMTEDEVKLCWGKGDLVVNSNSQDGQVVYWGYRKPQVVAYSGGISVWRDLVMKDVTFTNGVLGAWEEVHPQK